MLPIIEFYVRVYATNRLGWYKYLCHVGIGYVYNHMVCVTSFYMILSVFATDIILSYKQVVPKGTTKLDIFIFRDV